MIKSSKITFFISPLVLSMFAISAHAAPTFPSFPGIAHTPHIVVPGANNFAPGGMTPQKIQKAYGFTNITNQGEGQIVGIVDAYDDPNIEADLGVFSNAFGLPACTTANGCFTKVYSNGKPAKNSGWATEISLDVEWVHAVAPKAKIVLVEAPNASMSALLQAVTVAVKNNASVVSMSWGGGESSNETAYDSTFNVSGVSFTAASGDNGTEASYPAASPYVISVGGTTLNTDASGNYVSETAWSGSGGGQSAYETEPSYQTNLPIPNSKKHMRGIPDVSYNSDPSSGYSVYDSIPDQGQKGWFVVGGTSAAAPQWAAMIAIVNSISGTTLSNTNTLLYNAASGSNYALNYHDIVAGKNGSCGVICSAKSGYDYVTGLGTPQVPNLVNMLSSNSMYKRA